MEAMMISTESIMEAVQESLSIAVEKEVAVQMEPLKKECAWEKQELSDRVDELKYVNTKLRETLAQSRAEGRLKTEISGNLMVYLIKREGARDFERCDAQTYARFASGEVVEI